MENFEEVIGYDGLKKELERIVDILNNKSKYEKLGVKIPHGLMLEGVPGVGKSLMAKCFLNALNRQSYVLRKDMPENEFVVEIKKTFNEAIKNQPSVILVDDLDKFANDDEMHKNSECFVTLQSCVDNVKDLDIFVIATANSSREIPDSLLRAGRFDYKFFVAVPNGEDSEKIIKHYLEQKQYVKELDYKQISKILYGMTCAEIESVINQAGIYAGFAGKEQIELEDIIKACETFIFNAPGTMRNGDKKNEKVAIHEAGHAVVAELLNPESVTLMSLGGGDSNIGGFTATFQDDDDYFSDIENMKKKIQILLGGRAATEIIFGKTDVGAVNDLDRAKRIITRFVGEYAEFGFDKLGLSFHDKISNDYLRNREQTVANELTRYYKSTKELLTQNLEFLKAVSNAILEKRVLISKDILEIKEKIYQK